MAARDCRLSLAGGRPISHRAVSDMGGSLVSTTGRSQRLIGFESRKAHKAGRTGIDNLLLVAT